MTGESPLAVSGFLDWLGAIVEHCPTFLRWLGRLESLAHDHLLEDVAIDRPVFIAGMARSGTTILLELLAQHGDVATHQYRDYPLLHVPLWWNAFLDRASKDPPGPVERFHRDRIQVTPRSPEAMEEVLWSAFFPRCHDPTQTNVLDERTHAPGFERFFRAHVAKILLLRRGRRYLSKGNYNLTRLAYLARIFPDARFVVPVRAPVDHVFSLMKQHGIFCESEREDPRVTRYMRRLGHFEFGLERRPTHADDPAAVAAILTCWAEGREAEGLARWWSSSYGYLLRLLDRRPDLAEATLVVHYDDLCGTPVRTLERIYRHCGLETQPDALAGQASRLAKPSYYTCSLSPDEVSVIERETATVHASLRGLSRIPDTPQDTSRQPAAPDGDGPASDRRREDP